MKLYIFIISGILLFILASAVIRQLPSDPLVQGASKESLSISAVPTKQIIQGTDTLEVINERKDGLLYRYTSSDLGFIFTFISNPNLQGSTWYALRTDTTVCLTYDPEDTNCEKGQFVEVLSKLPEQSLADAIQASFLYATTPDLCFVKDYSQSNDMTPFEYAEISYPEDPNAESPFTNEYAQYCPERYRKANGVRYFMYNPAFSDRYAFFNIGQYAISGGTTDKAWQQTFVFTQRAE